MTPLNVSWEEVRQLQSIARCRSLPYSIVQMDQIVQSCETNTVVVRRFGVIKMTVGKWLRCYCEVGIEGLQDVLRPGRAPHLRG